MRADLPAGKDRGRGRGVVLIGDSDQRTNQDEASKGHLQPHAWRGPALGNHDINGLVEALAHQRRELRRFGGLLLTFQLVKASLAARTLVRVGKCIHTEIAGLAGFEQVRNFKQKLFAIHEPTLNKYCCRRSRKWMRARRSRVRTLSGVRPSASAVVPVERSSTSRKKSTER